LGVLEIHLYYDGGGKEEKTEKMVKIQSTPQEKK